MIELGLVKELHHTDYRDRLAIATAIVLHNRGVPVGGTGINCKVEWTPDDTTFIHPDAKVYLLEGYEHLDKPYGVMEPLSLAYDYIILSVKLEPAGDAVRAYIANPTGLPDYPLDRFGFPMQMDKLVHWQSPKPDSDFTSVIKGTIMNYGYITHFDIPGTAWVHISPLPDDIKLQVEGRDFVAQMGVPINPRAREIAGMEQEQVFISWIVKK